MSRRGPPWCESRPRAGFGSGVIFETEGRNAYILSSHDLVEDVDKVLVIVTDSTEYRGEVLGTDSVRGLAVVKICCGSFSELAFGDADDLYPGAWVMEFNYSLGKGGPATITESIVSVVDYDSRLQSEAFQINVPPMDLVDSSAPILSRSGQILGIGTFNPYKVSAEGLRFAISVRTLQGLIQDIAGRSFRSANDFISVSAGYAHTCGVKRPNGSVICWGDDDSGQATPPAGSFGAVSSGAGHTCGVRTDGSVVCWGNDDFGQAMPPDGSFSSISAGHAHVCGVKTDHSVVCWGYDEDGQATPPAGSFGAVSAGGLHTCGVKTDGSVACWGNNWKGQAAPPAGSFDAVSAAALHTCGVKTDGSVVCWGEDKSMPPAGSFSSVSAGVFHTCGVKTGGSVACWGNNWNGEATPPAGSFISLSAGDYHSCGVTTNGFAVCWGADHRGQATLPE